MPSSDFLITTCSARTMLEGPGVVVTFEFPLCLLQENGGALLKEDGGCLQIEHEATTVKVLRKKFGYPDSTTDGLIIYSGGGYSSSFSDRYRSASLTAQATSGTATLVLDTNQGWYDNGLIYIDDGTNQESHYISSVSSDGKTITLQTNLSNTYAIGSEVYSQPMVECTNYYYLFISNNGSYGDVYSSDTRAYASSGINPFFPDKLFDMHPSIYKRADNDLATAETSLATASDGEDFNINYDGLAEGPLKRFLRIMGHQLDNIKGLLDCISVERDVDTASEDFLGLLASYLGFEFNRELTTIKKRREIKQAVQLYKKKGTREALQAFIVTILGLASTPEIKEWRNNILCTNEEDRTLVSFTASEAADYLTINDAMSYIPDFGSDETVINPYHYSLFFDLSAVTLTKEDIEKLESRLPEFSPVCSEGHIHGTITAAEEIDAPTTTGALTTVTVAEATLYFSGDLTPDYTDREWSDGLHYWAFGSTTGLDAILQEDNYLLLKEDGGLLRQE